MSVCMSIGEGFALLAHKAALGSSVTGTALCTDQGVETRSLALLPVETSEASVLGSIDPEGIIGYDTPKREDKSQPLTQETRPSMGTGPTSIAIANDKVGPSPLPAQHRSSPIASESSPPFAPDAATDDAAKGDFKVSGGFSSFEGVNAKASLTLKGIRDRKQELNANLRYSDLQSLAELGFSDARFLSSETQFSARLFYNRLDAVGFTRSNRRPPFKQDSRGVSLYLGKKLSEELAVSAQYRLSRDVLGLNGRLSSGPCTAAAFGSSICNSLGKRTTSAISFGITHDTRDSGLFLTEGIRVRLVQDFSGLGGSTRFARTRIAGDGYLPIGDGWQVSVGAEIGLIEGSAKRVPIFDRFYLGGTTLRGFDLRGVGPRLQFGGTSGGSPSLDTAVGGKHYYTARIELGLPTGIRLGKTGIKPVMFADAGSVFGGSRAGILPGETLIGNSARPRVSLGIGLGWETPLGMLRLDAARPVAKQRGDRRQTLSISLGTSF